MSLSFLNEVRTLGVPFSLQLGETVVFKDNDARNAFNNCVTYNNTFNIPSSVMNCYGMFYNCRNLNHPIHIDPYGAVNDMGYMFFNCDNYQYDINIPHHCNSWYGMVNGDYQKYNGNIHVYSNEYQYGEGNFAWAFYHMYNFNGNVIFHDVNPTKMYQTFAYDFNFNRNIYIPDSVENMIECFYYCQNLNQNIHMPANLEDCTYAFYYCSNLNQSIRIPSGVNAYGAFMYCNNLNQVMSLPLESNLSYMFHSCHNLNQSLYVPYYNTEYNTNYEYNVWGNSSALISTNGSGLFMYCTNLNRPITFDDNIESLVTTLCGCENFNQIVTVPSHLKISHGTFSGCYKSFNQYITFPEGVIEMCSTFDGCYNFNQNIPIPSTVKKLTGCFKGTTINHNIQIPSGCVDTAEMFAWCDRLNQDIYIPSSVQNVAYMFGGCANYNGNPVLPQGVINCQGFANGCNNLYVDEAVIPNTVQEWGYERAFFGTKVINVNVLTHNAYSSEVISLANAINTSGKTPSGVHYEDLPWTHEDWQAFNFGTPIGHYKIPNDVCDDSYWQYNRIRDILGGLEYTSFESYQYAKETMQNESYWSQYNHGGLFHYCFQDEWIWHEAVYYKDYPNATSEEDTNWYFYEIIHY